MSLDTIMTNMLLNRKKKSVFNTLMLLNSLLASLFFIEFTNNKSVSKYTNDKSVSEYLSLTALKSVTKYMKENFVTDYTNGKSLT